MDKKSNESRKSLFPEQQDRLKYFKDLPPGMRLLALFLDHTLPTFFKAVAYIFGVALSALVLVVCAPPLSLIFGNLLRF